MKRLFLVFTIIFLQILPIVSAKTLEDYKTVPYIGKEINSAVNGEKPFVLVIANPDDKGSIYKYFPIGKMVYTEFKDKYDFCILNANVEENREYTDFFKPEILPEVYIVNPQKNIFGRINKKYHNTSDMRRILKNMLKTEKT